MNIKGQAALEFLTTYGWAFLVILIMIGALSYFGVLNPTKYVPDSCTFAPPFSCDASVVNQANATLRFRNNAEAITITSIVLTDLDTGDVYTPDDYTALVDSGTCTASLVAGPISCPSGGVATVTYDTNSLPSAPAFGTTGVKKKMKIDIKYYNDKSGASFSKTTGGDIVATVQ